MDSKTKFRLGKLLGLLGSEHDGEVIAAARAIGRELQSHGLSFGDLVNELQGNKPVAVRQEANGLASMAEAILQNAAMMRDHEIKFVRDIWGRALNFKAFEMTYKQERWFTFLYSKYAEQG